MTTAEATQWANRIKAAEEERRPHEQEWELIARHAAGSHFRRNFQPNARRQPINQLDNFVRLVLPHICPRDQRPDVQVTPMQPGLADSAQQIGDRVTAVMRVNGTQAELRDAVRRSFYSVGILKVGINPQTGLVVSAQPQTGESTSEASGQIDVDRDAVAGKEKADPGLPYVASVSPTRFLVQPGAESLNEAAWVAEETYRSLAALQADPRLGEWAKGLKATKRRKPRSMFAADSDAPAEEADEHLVKLYEIHDRDARRVFYLAADAGNKGAMSEPQPWTPGVEGFPYVLIWYHRVDGFFWPNPPLAPVYDIAVAPDELLNTAIQGALAAKRLFLYDPQVLTNAQVMQVADLPHLSIMALPGLSQSVQQFDVGGAPDGIMDMIAGTKALADEMMGVGQFRRGVANASPRASATEVQAAVQSSGVTLDDMLGAVIEAASEVAKMIAALLLASKDSFANLQLPLRRGDLKYVNFADPIEGQVTDYLFEVQATSAQMVDRAIVQKRLAELLTQSLDPNLVQKLQVEGATILTAPLLRRYLRSLGEQDPAEYLQPLPPPTPGQDGASIAAAEDQQMIQTGQPLEVAPDDDHAAHLQQHAADAQQTGSEAIAAHIMMHEQYLARAQGGAPTAPQNTGAAPPAPQSPAVGVGMAADQAGAIRRGL